MRLERLYLFILKLDDGTVMSLILGDLNLLKHLRARHFLEQEQEAHSVR